MTGLIDAIACAPATIAYVGNSVTAQRDGYCPRLHALLCARTGHAHRVVSAGFGGVGTIGSLCTMDMMALRERPALVFVECFTGDVGVGLHPLCGTAIEAMLAKIAAASAQPCMLLLPRADRAGAEHVAALHRRVAAHHGVPLVDLRVHWPDPGALLRDQVHSNATGSAAYAEAIADAVAGLPRWRGMAGRLFEPDLASAGVTLIGAAMIRGAARAGRFRLQLAYHAIGAGGALDFTLDKELLGLLLIVGPHSGTIAINGVVHDLRDRWTHYERLHALVLAAPVGTGTRVEIVPRAPGELRVAGLLSYRTARGSPRRPSPAAAP